MPKLTFFNLPEQKRKVLIEAAEKEFTRAPLYEASIANIVKTANIPRGSFYQYFEDKEDLYFYLLNLKFQEGQEDFIELIKKHDGDFIAAIKDMYFQFLVKIPDEEEPNFLRNAFLYATYKVERLFMNFFQFTDNQINIGELTKIIDKQKFKINDEEELLHVLQIVRAIAFQNFIEKINHKWSDDRAINNFTNKINVIKYGICRR